MADVNEGLAASVTLDQALADTSIYYVINIGYYGYYLLAMANLAARRCPFCNLDASPNRVEYEYGMWRVWQNPASKKPGVARDFVIAHKRHLTGGLLAEDNTGRMGPMDLHSLYEILRYLSETYNLPGGGLVMRFGDPRHNAGTVAHRHLKVLVPEGTGEVREPLAKAPEKYEQARARLEVFEKLRGAGTRIESAAETAQEMLTPAELKLVEGRLNPPDIE